MAIGYVCVCVEGGGGGKASVWGCRSRQTFLRMCQHDKMPLNCGTTLESELT